MPEFHADPLARFGREAMALAPEYLGRFPAKAPSDGGGGASTARARAFTLAAAAKQSSLGEFHLAGWTCGYFKNADGLAIIPIWGDLGPRRAFWPWVWYEDLAEAADSAAKDGDVKAILFHIDSPGGYVSGGAECVAAIEAAAALKPCAAFANDLAASMAFWIACGAGRISAPPTGIVASIGALQIHVEYSRALDEEGVTASIIRSAPRKGEANPLEPLTPAALAGLQNEITICGDLFGAAVARLRGIDEQVVRGTQAACLTIDQAIPLGLADAIETFDQACASLLARAAPPHAIVTSPAAVASPPVKQNPARGKAASPKARTPRARPASMRSLNMDPTTLPPEEQVLRYDEIAAIMAETPSDDAGKIGQFVQIAAIVNRPAGEETEPDPAEQPAEEPAAAKAAKAIANSPEGKANPAAALAAINAGMSLATFKAMAPHMAKGNGGLAARQAQNAHAAPLGPDGKKPDAKAASNVTALDPAGIFERRKAQAAGKK